MKLESDWTNVWKWWLSIFGGVWLGTVIFFIAWYVFNRYVASWYYSYGDGTSGAFAPFNNGTKAGLQYCCIPLLVMFLAVGAIRSQSGKH